MKNFFSSLTGAVVLSLLALISQVWRGFIDAMFVFPVDVADETAMHVAAIIYTLIIAGWAWAIFSMARGSRRGLLAAFIMNGVVWLIIPLSTLLFYCPLDCLADAGWVMSLVNTTNLVLGLLAAIPLAVQIGRGKSENIAESPAGEAKL